jgi:pimeloyl-ACP methyl ester carboxylesterase
VYPTNRIPIGNDTDVPTLSMWGTKDPFVTVSEIDHIGGSVTKHTVLELPDSGHWMPLEAPDLVAEKIVEFERPLR